MNRLPRHQAVVDRACGRKQPMDMLEAKRLARRLRRDGDTASAYRCPFAESEHWHVGHVPSLVALESIAAAIRNLPEPRKGG